MKRAEKNNVSSLINCYLKILSIVTSNIFNSFFNQRTHTCLLVLPKDTNNGVTLGSLFGGFILGVIVTAVATTLMYRRLKLRTRKRYICGQKISVFYLSNILHTCIINI